MISVYIPNRDFVVMEELLGVASTKDIEFTSKLNHAIINAALWIYKPVLIPMENTIQFSVKAYVPPKIS